MQRRSNAAGLPPRAASSPWRVSRAGAIGLVLAATLGCGGPTLEDQPRYRPLDASTFFEDGRASRPALEHTIARGQLRLDDHLFDGRVAGELAETFPFAITAAELARGRERFDIFCAPCHDRVGGGNGMIVQRGFPRPPSMHTPRLREAPAGHFFDVITRGFGAMPPYAHLVPPRDRWFIVGYVRALQFSQWAPLAVVPPDARASLEASSEGAP